MLVLSRKCGEKIVISDQNIILTVLEIRGDRIRLGIEAPADVPVHREEIWQRIQQFNDSAPVGAEPQTL
jgi:carbon storage regulator